MSQVYVGLLGSNAIHFLLFLGIAPSAVALVAIPFMKVHTRLLGMLGGGVWFLRRRQMACG